MRPDLRRGWELGMKFWLIAYAASTVVEFVILGTRGHLS